MLFAKKYFQDKLILLLLTVEVFLMLLNTALILLRIGNQQTDSGYFIQYRANLGIGAFKTGGIAPLLEFILFGALVVAIHTVLSIKMYPIRRQVAIGILALGMLLLVVSMIVSNALLALR
jgi:hypothetical protein